MHFGIFDEERVRNLTLSGNRPILIRIFSPNTSKQEHTVITNKDSYIGILELYLKDYVENPKQNELKESFEKLNQFILENDFDEVIVHCSMGISRSPAIMICIAKMLNNSKLEEYIKRNFRLYNRIIVKELERFSYTVKDLKDETFLYDEQSNIGFNKHKTLSMKNFIIIEE